MRALLTSIFNPISPKQSSHRGAQAHIYYDQTKPLLAKSGITLDIDYGDSNYGQYDSLLVYHGNDFFGSLNLFGGIENFNNPQNVVDFSKFKGEVCSIAIPFFNYPAVLQDRIRKLEGKCRDVGLWKRVDWENFSNIVKNAKFIDTNVFAIQDKDNKIVAGDSHAICMYRPNWLVNSVPYSTLHGSINKGLESFIRYTPELNDINFSKIELYFGNLDIRHHLMRQDNPKEATISLVKRYIAEAEKIAKKTKSEISIYYPLPIESESRKIPKTGWYKGSPFYGSWEDRNAVRDVFISTLKRLCSKSKYVNSINWTNYLMNTKGELDSKYMEKPRSVHLSREFYPYWQGSMVGKINKSVTSSLDAFL